MSVVMLSKIIVNLEEKYLHEEDNCVNVKDLEIFAPPVHLRRIWSRRRRNGKINQMKSYFVPYSVMFEE